MLRGYIIAGLAVVALGTGAWGAWLQSRLHDAEIETARVRGALASCEAAANIVNEDATNDATIDPDNLPDFDDLDDADRVQ